MSRRQLALLLESDGSRVPSPNASAYSPSDRRQEGPATYRSGRQIAFRSRFLLRLPFPSKTSQVATDSTLTTGNQQAMALVNLR